MRRRRTPNLSPAQPLAAADDPLFRSSSPYSAITQKKREVAGTFGKYWATNVMQQGLWRTTLEPKGPDPISLVSTEVTQRGGYPPPSGRFERDHLVPLALGGDTTPANPWPQLNQRGRWR